MKIFILLSYLCLFLTLFDITFAGVDLKKKRTKLPSFVSVCRRHDPALNACVQNSIHLLREDLKIGIPELFVPPIEPLVVPEVKLDQDSGAIYLHSTYRNISIHGLSNFTVKDVKVDPKQLKFEITLRIPNITMNSLYKMKGKIMLMPLMGEGLCRSNFTDVEMTTKIVGQRFKRNEDSYIKIKTLKVDYTVGKAKLKLDNLFNGDKAMSDRMNLFLNDNWDSLAEEFKPLMQEAVAEIIRKSVDQIFATYTYDDLLPE